MKLRFIHHVRPSVAATAVAGLVVLAATVIPASAVSATDQSTTAQTTPPTCASVRAELGRSQGAAGSTFQTIRLRNMSTTSCRMGGFPLVGFVNAHHRLIGWPAGLNRRPHHPHVVAPGQAARTVLQIPDPGNFAAMDCLRHKAHQLKVRTPDAGHASFLRWGKVECTTRFARSHVSPIGR